MTDNPRLGELRRRVQQDPASIAFAQRAGAYRRVGQLDEAVRVCRPGLAQHPACISAHVTLGRALMARGRDDEAQAELRYILRAAPDNLLAVKSGLRSSADGTRRQRAATAGWTIRRPNPPGSPS